MTYAKSQAGQSAAHSRYSEACEYDHKYINMFIFLIMLS